MSEDKIWVGIIPEINNGYGMNVIAKNKDDAMVLLEKEFNKNYNQKNLVVWNRVLDFEESMEYFGGVVKELTIGRVYFSDFKE